MGLEVIKSACRICHSMEETLLRHLIGAPSVDRWNFLERPGQS